MISFSMLQNNENMHVICVLFSFWWKALKDSRESDEVTFTNYLITLQALFIR